MPTPAHERALEDAGFVLYDKPGDGAFLFALMCNLEREWDNSIPTACTDGLTIKTNPDWFLSLPPETRAFVLAHELWHVGLLHPLRAKDMNHQKYNAAADYCINLMLTDDGYTFNGTTPLWDARFRGMSTEEIYALLPDMPEALDAFTSLPGAGDIQTDTAEEDPLLESKLVGVVQTAIMAQQRQGYTSDRLEAINSEIQRINTAVIRWEDELLDFCNEKCRAGLNYKRRNRRYPSVYIPARGTRGKLTTLFFFFDVSGSVTDAMISAFMNNVKYIQEVMGPDELHIIQFDTHIQKINVFHKGDSLDTLKVVGRGGTSLVHVADYIQKHKPVGSVIMSDLDCPQMRVVPGASILWLCINDPNATVNQGKLIHISV